MKAKSITPDTCVETSAPRILALGLLAVLLLLALTGCKNAATNTAEIYPVGVYNLVSIDGKTVPCNLTHEGAAMVVKSGSLTFNADGTCRSLSIFSIPPHPDIRREVNATCTQNGAELTMRWQGAGITKGQINGDTFTMNNEGMIFCYRK
jgi:hypothetical protein